jgi:hypothetical protein
MNNTASTLVGFGAMALLANSLWGKTKMSPQDMYDHNPELSLYQIDGLWCFVDYITDKIIYKVKYAETFDGNLDASEVSDIVEDGDCWNLLHRRNTRHAKYLVCEKA